MDTLLGSIATVSTGYQSRGRILPDPDGSHYLLQVGDIDEGRERVSIAALPRFTPRQSTRGAVLAEGDVLFMAKGAANFALVVPSLPEQTLAAGYFFVIRVGSGSVLPTYVTWYLNQKPAEHYFRRHAGQGVNMPVVRRAVLEQCPIQIPPVAKQRHIVELDSLLREEVRLQRQLIDERTRYVQAVCLRAAEKE